MAADYTILPAAAQDAEKGYRWYENQRAGLGHRFLDELEACIGRICQSPKAFTPVLDQFRRALLKRFPYAIFYEYAGGRVTIHAVFHCSQNPDKWHERLSD
jgi:plasmid stabilization system protein ParE